VLADVFEQDIASVKPGTRAKVRIGAYPGQDLEGTITYVYPTLKPETRTVPVRLEIANPRGLLKPGMFAEVELASAGKGKVLSVPTSAVMDSGAGNIVLVQLAEGLFEPREVKLGSRGENYVEVTEGIRDGEQVVVAANFLIDAESNLKAAIGGFGNSGPGAAPPKASANAKSTVGHRAEGKVEAIDPKSGGIKIAHGPVESLKWPGMTMEFKVANESLLATLKPGSAISFEFVERSPGEWVITKITPKAGASVAAGAPATHPAGH
jgi:Cu/Ag efflux protein CusF